jgi:flagellar biosynthesis/type III secretory pathway protein FliH
MLMPLRETIRLHRPLRDARATCAALAAPDTAAPALAEYERGRREGEKALSEQLIRQRGELIELQNGVLTSLRKSIHDVTRECEGAMIALALEIAGKLVADLPISSEMVEAAVREAWLTSSRTATSPCCSIRWITNSCNKPMRPCS